MALKKLLGHLLNADPEMRPKAVDLLENAWIIGNLAQKGNNVDVEEEGEGEEHTKEV